MKYFVLIGLILTVILVSGCTQTDGGVEVKALKSLSVVSDVAHPSVVNGETVQFKFEVLEAIHPDYYFRLILPEGVEYVDGDFELLHDEKEVYLEPSGQPGYNVQGNYLGEDAEKWIMKLDKTEYFFTLKAVSTGRHTIALETNQKENGARTNDFVEVRSLYFCSGDTLEDAVNLCLQQEVQCMTRECVEQRLQQQAVQE